MFEITRIDYFSYFPQKIGFGISCKLSTDNLHEMSKLFFFFFFFSGKNSGKKNINLSFIDLC